MNLGSIANIKMGYSFRGPVIESADATTRVIQMRDMDANGDIDWNTLITSHLLSKSRRVVFLSQNDILLLTRSHVYTSTYLAEIPYQEVIATSHFCVIKVTDPRFHPAFVAWQLNQHPARNYFRLNAKRTVAPYIPLSVIANTDIKMADKKRQDQVVELQMQFKKDREAERAAAEARRKNNDQLASEILMQPEEY